MEDYLKKIVIGGVSMEHLDFERFVDLVGSSCKNSSLKLDKPMVISFYAPWCPACQDVLDIFTVIEKDYIEHIDQFKVNTDEEEILSSFFGVKSLPTMVFFANNQKPEITIGRVNEERLHELLRETITKHNM
jgi:thioredoxin-like negative regulator of GroEL